MSDYADLFIEIPTARDLYGPPNVEIGELITFYRCSIGKRQVARQKTKGRALDDAWQADESEHFWTLAVELEPKDDLQDGDEVEVYWDNCAGTWEMIE